MSHDDYDRGPLLPYEVMWRSGHREIIHAHQVLLPHDDSIFAAYLGVKTERRDEPRISMHGEIDGKWQLVLHADAKDILSIKRVLTDETATTGDLT